MSWPLVKLGSILKVASGFAFKSKEFVDTGYPIIRISNIDGSKVNLSDAAKVPETAIEGKDRFLVQSGDILIAMSGATTGKLGVVPEGVGKIYLNQRVGKFHFDSNIIYSKYLYFFLLSGLCQTQINLLAAGAAQPNISGGQLESIEIPLPPLSVQKQIAAVLEKADTLRSQCQQMEQELNSLAQSVFLDMFGEPTNYPGHRVKLKECIYKIESGWSPKCKTSVATNGQNGILKLGAVTSGIYKEEENKEMLDGAEPKPNLEVQQGDLLFTRKNTFELVAATAYVRETKPNLYLPDLIFRFVPKPDFPVSKIFLWALFSSKNFRASIQSLATGAAGSMPNISKAKLAEVEIPMPPLSEQEKFSQIVAGIWGLQDIEERRIENAENNFNSLMQRAFKGELKLKEVS